jgi:2-keto-4-pentenoate hydratase
MSSVDIGAVSRELLEARDHARLVDPVSATEPAFSVDEAYQVARLNHDVLLARGEQPIGRKIGFTNRGIGSNVLDGPLQAVAHLVTVLAKQERFPLIAAGEIVTTGTLTVAWPVAPGQVWQTALEGIGLSGIKVRFA